MSRYPSRYFYFLEYYLKCLMKQFPRTTLQWSNVKKSSFSPMILVKIHHHLTSHNWQQNLHTILMWHGKLILYEYNISWLNILLNRIVYAGRFVIFMPHLALRRELGFRWRPESAGLRRVISPPGSRRPLRWACDMERKTIISGRPLM